MYVVFREIVLLSKKESKVDFGKRCLWHHVIPVKLAGELSQPLDSLRMVVVTHSFSEVY